MLRQAVIVITTAFIFKNLLHYFLDKPEANGETSSSKSSHADAKLILTQKELSEKSNEKEFYLAILGHVYDVTKGAQHYKPGGSYHFFLGKDASRAFVTGDFTNDLNDDIESLSDAQVADIFNWKKMYDKNYGHVGYVVGRFYDANGAKTELLRRAEEIYASHKEMQKSSAQYQQRFPSCNSEWSQERGLHKVWCTRESGGVKRAWSGYPRLVYNPSTKSEGCACVNDGDLEHPNVRQYAKCDPRESVCDPSQT